MNLACRTQNGKERFVMAEFGENLKRIREEKGLTQQTLADHLYVTRQAVSRWEGGSRYPDLMTAKKMAQFLEVSLDELLSDDDMKQYVEKNAILDSAVSKRVQVVLIALAFMSSLALSILYLCNYLIRDTYVLSSPAEIVKCILLTLVLGYGVYAALYDKINPKMAIEVAILFLGTGLLSGLTVMFYPALRWQEDMFLSVYLLGSSVLNIVFLICCIRFFSSKKVVSPIPIYVLSGIYAGMGILMFFGRWRADVLPELLKDITLINIFGLLEGLVLLILLVCMAYVLDRKRKLTMIDKEPAVQNKIA